MKVTLLISFSVVSPRRTPVQRRVHQEVQAFLRGKLAHLRRRFLFENHLPDQVGEVEQFVDRGPPTVPGAAALDAAASFPELEPAPVRGVQPGELELRVRVGCQVTAVLTDPADQPLRQDAVQRGHEVVGLDAHDEETSEHVDDIVRVDRCEDQVADQRCFLVADFTDQDFVRVVPENGAKATREGEAFLLVDPDLRDAADLVLDGVFDGDDFVFIALNFVERGVKRRRFAGTGRSRDQYHAVGLADVAAVAAQVLFAEAHDVSKRVIFPSGVVVVLCRR